MRASDVVLDDAARPSFGLLTPEGRARVQLRGHGEHVLNALGAAAAWRVAGLDVDDIAARLGSATPQSRWRMEVIDRADGVTVVNDAYNANPDSVRAALQALVTMGKGRRTWARAGRDARARSRSGAEHAGIGRFAVGPVSIASWLSDQVLMRCIAPRRMSVLVGGTGLRGRRRRGRSRAACRPATGDVVLVKASRAASLERVAPPAGGSRVRGVIVGSIDRTGAVLVRDAARDPHPRKARVRSADPRRRSDHPPHQARHADDGRRGHHPGHGHRLRVCARVPRWPPTASGLLVLYLMVGLGFVPGSWTTTSR